jgi:hypothetical protein
MFSKRTRVSVLVAAAVTLGGVFAYVAPASNIDRAPLDDRLGIADDLPTIRPWGEDLSKSAVDAAGIERDLDGNTRALFASDQWCGRPACGNPRLP